MSSIDFATLLFTLLFITFWGIYKTRNQHGVNKFLKGSDMSWRTIGLSVMATQASAITFLSTPGLGFDKGMSFVQNYFGLPIAMIVVCLVFIPLYYKQKVYSAYQYLENRFDRKTRYLGSALFLIQRGLAAGITLYAPSIVLSHIFGWDLNIIVITVGLTVVVYTISGGTQAVFVTHRHQMTIILFGMILVFVLTAIAITDHVSVSEAFSIAGALDKMTIVNYDTNLNERYTIWTGLIGGFFLALSYFGTDQSQVQRYLGGKSAAQSQIGMIFNAIVKVPMQFGILLLGVMIFIFYLWTAPPTTFLPGDIDTSDPVVAEQIKQLETAYNEQRVSVDSYVEAMRSSNEEELLSTKSKLQTAHAQYLVAHSVLVEQVKEQHGLQNVKESDYVFLNFIQNQLPIGILGLLVAVIISAAMSSTASELNALSTISTVDFYQTFFPHHATKEHTILLSRIFTLFWGILAIAFALFATLLESLIEAVNIIGSLFYGSILGIFLTAFFLKFVRGSAVFIAAILAEAVVISLYVWSPSGIAYLWYNPIGCILVMIFAVTIQTATGSSKTNNHA